jgi:hypothetical protein
MTEQISYYKGPGYYSAHPADSDTHLPCLHLGFAGSENELASLILEAEREVEQDPEWRAGIRIDYHVD